MKPTRKITLALGLLVAGAGFAQTTTSSSNGLLGQRYAEFAFGLQDIKFISDHAYAAGVAANTPLVPGALDAGVNYSHTWLDAGNLDVRANSFGGYVTAYAPLNGVKPFVGAAVGWEWTRFTGFGTDDGGLWALTAGVEIPLGTVTLTPRVTYADDFEHNPISDQQWTYELEANCWVNAKTAVFGSVGKTDVVRSPAEAWNYRIGVRLRF